MLARTFENSDGTPEASLFFRSPDPPQFKVFAVNAISMG